MNAYGYFKKSNTSLSKVIWPNATVLLLYCFLPHIYVTPNSSHHIPSCLTHPVKHMDPHLWLLPALTFPHFIFTKLLNQNMIWYNCNCTQHITHILQYRPFSSHWPLSHLQQIIVFLFTIHFNHSSIFDSPNFSFNNFLPINPHIFKRSVSWIPSLSTYLGSVFWLIQFTLFQLQPSRWPWGNGVPVQPLPKGELALTQEKDAPPAPTDRMSD